MGLVSTSVFVLITDNKFDFYKITEIANKKYKIRYGIKTYDSKKDFSQSIN
jgi:hypothetical protein